MKFDVNKFGLAAGFSAVVISSLVHISMRFMFSGGMMGMMQCPYATSGNQGMMTHMFTPTVFLTSLLWIFVFAYSGAALFAWTYNRLVKK